MKNIVVIYTGCSNLFSIVSAIKKLGYLPKVTTNIKKIINAEKVFLPGVGTIQSIVYQLKTLNLINTIKKIDQPFLGICLGMQILGRKSEENQNIKSLGIISRVVKKIQNKNLSVPHTGWNKVFIRKKNVLFNKIENGSYFYFSHSYAFTLCKHTIAQTNYGKYFSAAIKKKNFFGVQFHPERSGNIGQQLIKNFLEI